jgi:GT2 family glycosyltransferase
MVSFYTGPELFSAIASVLSQRVPVELIVVDNGNPEQAVEALKRKSSADPRMKLVTGHGNVGFGKGNNMGVAESRGDYVLILNPDSRLNDESLAKLHSHADALPHPFMIGARILNEDGSDQRGCRRELLTPCSAFVEALHLHCLFPRLRLNLHEEPVPASITPMPAISGAFMFLSREDYDLIGGFDDGYFLHVEDLDFCFRFHKAGGEIYFAPDVPVTHTGSTSLSTTDFLERHKAKGFTRYFHRNFRGKYPLILLWSLDIAIWGRYILRRSTNFIASRIK